MTATNLLQNIWFLPIYPRSQAKTGLSVLVPMLQLGASYPSALRILRKLMTEMATRKQHHVLHRAVRTGGVDLGR